jgi:hypothetical protein
VLLTHFNDTSGNKQILSGRDSNCSQLLISIFVIEVSFDQQSEGNDFKETQSLIFSRFKFVKLEISEGNWANGAFSIRIDLIFV